MNPIPVGFLPGYEYRMCIKLGTPLVTAQKGSQRQRLYTQTDFEANRAALEADGWRFSMNAEQTPQAFVATAFQRHCVDIETKELVAPWKRIWIWDDDMSQALLDQSGAPICPNSYIRRNLEKSIRIGI